MVDVAKKLGAKELIVVGLLGDVRAPSVFVRGVEVTSGHLRWSGNARYEDYVATPIADHVIIATCRALGAAWKFQTPNEEPNENPRCTTLPHRASPESHQEGPGKERRNP